MKSVLSILLCMSFGLSAMNTNQIIPVDGEEQADLWLSIGNALNNPNRRESAFRRIYDDNLNMNSLQDEFPEVFNLSEYVEWLRVQHPQDGLFYDIQGALEEGSTDVAYEAIRNNRLNLTEVVRRVVSFSVDLYQEWLAKNPRRVATQRERGGEKPSENR